MTILERAEYDSRLLGDDYITRAAVWARATRDLAKQLEASERRAQTARELVEKWRGEAQVDDEPYSCESLQMCANELETALAAPEPTP